MYLLRKDSLFQKIFIITILFAVMMLSFLYFTSPVNAMGTVTATDVHGIINGTSGNSGLGFSGRARATGPDTVNPGQTFSVSLYAWCQGDDFSPKASIQARFNGVNSPATIGDCIAGTPVLVETRSVTAPMTPGVVNVDLYAVVSCSSCSQPANSPTVYSYTVAPPPNTPPNGPSISGPTTGDTGTTYNFTLTATDPDGDNISYKVDWDNNGTVDEITGTVASGVSQVVSRSWGSDGTYTFKVKTYDGTDYSAWKSHSITISTVAPSVTLSLADYDIPQNGNAVVTWTVTGSADSCTASGDYSGWDTFNPSKLGGTQSFGPINLPNVYEFSIECSNTAGSSGLKTVYLKVGPMLDPPACPLTPQAGRQIVDWSSSSPVLYSNQPVSLSISKERPVSLVNGKDYKVTAVAYDGSTGRAVGEVQTNESIFIRFKNGASTVHETGATSDIPDGVEEASVNEVVDTFTMSGSADSAVAVHDAWWNASANSVRPVCAAIDEVTPAPPSIDVSPGTLPFGDVEVGTSSEMQFVVTNKGGGTLTVNANPSITGPFAGSYTCVSASCSSVQTISASSSKTYTVRYTPTTTSTSQTATLQLTGTESKSVSLTGNGIPTPPPLPTANFTSPLAVTVNSGDTTDLSWTSTGADVDSCKIEEVAGGTGATWASKPTTSSLTVLPSKDTTYRVTCSNSSGSGSSAPNDVVVTVNIVPPVCAFSPSSYDAVVDFIPTYIQANGSLAQSEQSKLYALPAGEYNAFLHAWDGGTGRSGASLEPNEKYHVELNSGGVKIAQTGHNDDLLDGVEWDEWTGQVDTSLVVASDVLEMVAKHTMYPDGNPNSIYPICVAFNDVTPPSSDLKISIDGGSWQDSLAGDIYTSNNVRLQWDSSHTSTCTGTGFVTGGATSNLGGINLGSLSAGSYSYELDCNGAIDTIPVNVIAKPNLTGNLSETPSTTYDPVTGNYSYVDLQIGVNNSGAPTGNGFTVLIEVDPDGFGSGAPVSITDSYTVPALTASGLGSSDLTTRRLNNIPFGGVAEVRVTIDSNDDVDESDESATSNIITDTIGGTVPDVVMDISLDPSDLVRGGGNVVIDWDTNANFPMSCVLTGPAIFEAVSPISLAGPTTSPSFNPSSDGPTGTATAGPITTKSQYTLQCVETNTSTPFTSSVSVETTGYVQEI